MSGWGRGLVAVALLAIACCARAAPPAAVAQALDCPDEPGIVPDNTVVQTSSVPAIVDFQSLCGPMLLVGNASANRLEVRDIVAGTVVYSWQRARERP